MRPGAQLPGGVRQGVLRADGAQPGGVRPDAVMPDGPDTRAETFLLWDCR